MRGTERDEGTDGGSREEARFSQGRGLLLFLIPPLVPTMGTATCLLNLYTDRTLCHPAQRSV